MRTRRAIVRIIDPTTGRAVEFPQIVVTAAALDDQLQRLRAQACQAYQVPSVYGYIVYREG